MPSRTFILGAGFSAAEQFPLIRDLKERVIRFVEAERHSLYQAFLQSGNGRFPRGQFYAGLDAVDPTGTLGFEEVLIALRRRLKNADDRDPCFVTRNVLQSGCARLFWSIHSSIHKLSPSYDDFAGRLRRSATAKSHAVISFNWDVLVERALWDSHVPWTYSTSDPDRVPVLKPHGSINWSSYVKDGGVSDYPGWKPIADGSQLCFDASRPLLDPDPQEVNPTLRYMLFPGDPELPEHDRDLKLIWSEVARAIAERDVLVFLGYSMPDYDSFTAQFFRQFARSKHIEVYNPSDEHLDRFRTVFGSGAQLFRQTFQQSPYVRSPEAVADGT
jgi:hypothetical protein